MTALGTTDDGFTLDGAPFRMISGALHYFRVHPEHWEDRMRKAKWMGLNTVDTYVPWNLHEPQRGVVRVDAELDLPRFVGLAQEHGLHVLLRPGPYICAEWEGGGLPSWLLAEPDVRLRSTDPRFLDAVESYFAQLWPSLLDTLASRGGPVLAVQVENEYGAHGDDAEYLRRLVDLLRGNGVDVPLFTCDQPGDLARGGLPDVLRTVTFGSRATEALAALREHQPTGPLMCSEFWNGWFDEWGGHHVTRPAADAAATLDEMLTAGASVNFYMFHGGTNFGFTNGANDKGTYRPTVTSYDYDSPLSEAGDPTPKYHAFREVIAKHAPVPPGEPPAAGPKLAVPEVLLTDSAPLLGSAGVLGAAEQDGHPFTMEELGRGTGFVLYETTVEHAGPALLDVTAFGDRVQVFLAGVPVGVLERERHEHVLALTVPHPGAALALLVENQGRVNYGPAVHDRKGITGPVLLDGVELGDWTSTALPLDDLADLRFTPTSGPPVGPAFHRGVVHVDTPADTFLSLDGWTKGNAWVNGFHLGRYWSRGPQRTLYVPAPVLRPGANEITVLELHSTRRPAVALRAEPDLGPTER
ncbi:glycoside hydrolase family 35 protein [Umezawaea beigongshangensis]|uniref:glycoside hydrolase family 35 protein n=1 Tax=Umezawaea beigongshangensis TaxID=2780383 RepID=UPI0018F1A28D|nr:beta-galactosidase [Umezawaea beigongshangensis]